MDFLATWRVIDLISAPARRIQQAASAAQAVMDRAGRAMGGSFNRATSSVNSLREQIDALRTTRDSLRIHVDTTEIANANRQLASLQAELQRVERRNGRADGTGGGGGSGGLIGMMSRRLLPMFALSTLAASGTGFASAGMDREMVQAKYQQFSGEQKGLETFNQLNKFGNDSIYKNSDVLSSGARIVEQFGADKALSQIKMYGNLAGGDGEALKGITRTMGQIKGVGRLQGDEMNELANHGILGLQDKIASMKGVSVATFNKMKEAGKISFEDVQKALESITGKGGKYFGYLDRMAGTTFGRMQKFIGTIQDKFASLSVANLPGLNDILDWLNKFVDNFKPAGDAIMKFGKSFAPLFDAVRQILVAFGILPATGDGVISTIDTIASVVNKLAGVVGFVGSVFNNLVTGIRMLPFGDIVIKILSVWAALQFFGGVTGIFNTVKVAWLALNAGFLATPIGWIVVGVVALVAALTYAWQNSEKFREVVIRSWEAVKAVWNSMKPYFDKVGTWISDAWKSVVEFFGKLGNTLKDAKESILNIWDKFQTKTEGVFTKIGTFIKNTIRIALATATLGMSEIAIFAYNKFANVAKAGYNGKGVNAVVLSVEQQRNRDKDRSGTEAARAARRLARMEDKNHDGVKDKPFAEMGGGAGAGGKGSGISDTVEGAKSKTINITIKNMIETINNNVSSEAVGKKVSDDVLDTLNRLFASADKLAFE